MNNRINVDIVNAATVNIENQVLKLQQLVSNLNAQVIDQFGSAWSSTNATMVNDSIVTIGNNLTEIKKCIDTVQKKVSKFATGTASVDSNEKTSVSSVINRTSSGSTISMKM